MRNSSDDVILLGTIRLVILVEQHVAAIDNSRLIWIDLEMTGLDTVNDHIIEIATVVTDKDLTVLAEGPVLAIHQPDSVLAAVGRIAAAEACRPVTTAPDRRERADVG